MRKSKWRRKLEDAIIQGGKYLIAQLLMSRHYNREAFKQMMKKILRPIKGVQFRDLNATLMLIEFDDLRDKSRVIREGPWSFDKHLVLIKEVDGNQPIHRIQLTEALFQLTEALFWIQLHDLPLSARNEYVGNLIGSKVGHVEEVDLEKGEMAWGEFMRERVKIDVTNPLLRGKMLNLGLHEPVWLCFSYERLLDFCYYCGRIGHGHKDCKRWQGDHPIDETNCLPYGQWLRSSSTSGRGWNRREQKRQAGHASLSEAPAGEKRTTGFTRIEEKLWESITAKRLHNQ